MEIPTYPDEVVETRVPEYVDPPFEEFSKMSRWREVSCTVTEKIDGSNAQIYVPVNPDHPVLAGSRTRWIGPRFGCDNFGFGAWVAQHAEVLRRLGPGRHFGEWWGAGIQRRYGLDGKRFSLFNLARFAKSGLPEGLPSEVGLVPELYRGPFDARKIDEVIAKLYREGSVAAPGWRGAGKAGPEGVVIRIDGGLAFKLTDHGDAKKGRQHHIDAALGALNVVANDDGYSVSGRDINGILHAASAAAGDPLFLNAALQAVANSIVDADATILDARKAGV